MNHLLDLNGLLECNHSVGFPIQNHLQNKLENLLKYNLLLTNSAAIEKDKFQFVF